MAGADDGIVGVSRWGKGIERLHQCIAGRFRSPGPRRRLLDYLKALLNPVARQNVRQPAERAGDAIPFGLLPAPTQSLGSPGSVVTVGIQLPR